MLTDKIWANSGDSHAMEPDDLWDRDLPRFAGRTRPACARDERMRPCTSTARWRSEPCIVRRCRSSAPGARDPKQRLADLDEEGVWGQLMFPSRGLWVTLATDPVLYAACARVYNDWMLSEMMSVSPRLVGVAMLSSLSTDDAVAELQRVVSLGYQAVMVPCTAPEGRGYNDEVWDPLWAAAEEAGVVVAFHVGTGASPKAIRGPGAVVSNYVETFVPGQRVVSHLVASGVLERHPGLRVLIAEGGASWVPALADRMDEGWRQHGQFAKPKLTKLPERDDLRAGVRIVPA